MKIKTVTVTFDYSTFENLDVQLEKLKSKITDGNEYYEKVYTTKLGKRFIQFKQEYKMRRTFKLINENEVIVKSIV